MSRDYLHSIADIVECLYKISTYVEDFTEQSFEKNDVIQDAVIRRLEIIGESVKNLPDFIRERHPDIPWRSLAGLRDVIIHQYFGVSTAMIWRVTQVDVPILIEKFDKLKN